jgi:hypothetical protein
MTKNCYVGAPGGNPMRIIKTWYRNDINYVKAPLIKDS